MNWRVRKIVAMVCCLVLCISIVGCAKTGTSGENVTPTSETKQDTSTADSDTAATEEKVTLTVTLWDYTSLAYHSKLVKAFEDKYPNVTVNVVEAPASDYNDKVSVMFAGDSNLDVVFVRDTSSYTSFIAKNQLEPLDEYIQSAGIDLSKYGGMCEQYAVNDSIYGLPYRKDVWMLFYNKDIFDTMGVAYPKDGISFEEYRDLAKQLTSGEGNEKIYGALNNTWLNAVSNLTMNANKADFLSGDYSFLKPCYELVLKMQNEDKTSFEYATLKSSNIHYSGPFYNAQVAMLPMGSWFINNMIENLATGVTTVNYDVATMPSEQGGNTTSGVGQILNIAMSSKSQNKEWAWKFIEFATGEEGAKVLAESGIIPAYNSTEILNVLKGLAGFPAHAETLLSNVTNLNLEFPADEKWSAISAILNEEHELIMFESNSVEDGIEAMNKRVQEEVLNQ